MLILHYKSLFLSKYPIYMMNMFNLCILSYNLCGNYILTLPVTKTTSYGLHSFPYHAATGKQWNLPSDSISTSDFTNFKKKQLASLNSKISWSAFYIVLFSINFL